MRSWLLLVLVLLVPPCSWAEDQRLEWFGVEFCKANLVDLLTKYPGSTLHPKYPLLVVKKSGITLGGSYDMLIYRVRPDGIIMAVSIVMTAGNFEEIEKQLNATADDLWGDEVWKIPVYDDPESVEKTVSWIGRTGKHLHMRLGGESHAVIDAAYENAEDLVVVSIGSNSRSCK